MKVLRSILFIFLFALIGFVLAAWLPSLTIERPSGLAGPGIVVGTGLFGAIGGIIISTILVIKVQARKIIVLNIIFSLVLLFFILFLSIRLKKEKAKEPITQLRTQPISFIAQGNSQKGLGMAKPDFYNQETIYFYNPNLNKAVDEHLPLDSISFMKTEMGVSITYAPPWFFPEHIKMDYGILYLKVISKTQDWVQLEVNKQSKKMVWVNISSVDILYWPEFLLKASSVEFNNGDQRVFVKPLENASIVNVNYTFMKPLEVRDQWMRVLLLNEDLTGSREGWIKWNQNGELLVSYNLLS